ncbi:hypothetical protein CCB80_02985 [Armatimonadetes bacterium Uphvl-Ar1]|nr:hypothetical protein CCB80_02985 [Armatimonadetes bacterium Uphvl-Ar1]
MDQLTMSSDFQDSSLNIANPSLDGEGKGWGEVMPKCDWNIFSQNSWRGCNKQVSSCLKIWGRR